MPSRSMSKQGNNALQINQAFTPAQPQGNRQFRSIEQRTRHGADLNAAGKVIVKVPYIW